MLQLNILVQKRTSRIIRNNFPGTNTLAYFAPLSVTMKISLSLKPGANVIKHFLFINDAPFKYTYAKKRTSRIIRNNFLGTSTLAYLALLSVTMKISLSFKPGVLCYKTLSLCQ
jgi:hypothetical protein